MAARYGESKSTLSYFVKTGMDNVKQTHLNDLVSKVCRDS